MRILGIESSSLVASVAILEDESIIAEYNVNYKKTHSQTLLPMLEEIVSRIDFDLQTIDAIAISSGPGSFTGLRIGVATAKGLGLGLDKPLIAVPTLDATAYNISNTKSLICPIMDARRQQVYTGIFKHDKEFEVVEAAAAMDINDLLEKLKGFNEEVIFLGDGVPVYKSVIEENAKFDFCFALPSQSRQRAGSLVSLAAEYFKEGKLVSADDMLPEYLRLSQAERERAVGKS